MSRSRWDQLERQLVQLGGLAGVLIAQRPASIDQQSQRRELLVVDDRPSPASGADQGRY